MPADSIINELNLIFDSNQIKQGDTTLPADLVVYPVNSSQISELVKWATTNHTSLFPLGGGTHFYPSISKAQVAVSLTKMSRLIMHSPEDMSATVPAGIKFNDVQNRLYRSQQRIPLDFPSNNHATIGGMISANVSGAMRYKYGTAKDWVIQTELINGEGKSVKSGANVVKNVSGYDLNKLYIGARGTLGILTQISFKLTPLPEKKVTFQSNFRTITDIFQFYSKFKKVHLDIESIAIVNGIWMLEKNHPWCFLVELSGYEKGLLPQMDLLSSLFKHSNTQDWKILTETESSVRWNLISDNFQTDSPSMNFNGSIIKITLPKKELFPFLSQELNWLPNGISIKIFPSCGIFILHLPENKEKPLLTKKLIEQVKSVHGWMEFVVLPSHDLQERWPIIPSSFPWMEKIKRILDPANIFSPGTYIGGL